MGFKGTVEASVNEPYYLIKVDNKIREELEAVSCPEKADCSDKSALKCKNGFKGTVTWNNK